jgi:hypothetical protein
VDQGRVKETGATSSNRRGCENFHESKDVDVLVYIKNQTSHLLLQLHHDKRELSQTQLKWVSIAVQYS